MYDEETLKDQLRRAKKDFRYIDGEDVDQQLERLTTYVPAVKEIQASRAAYTEDEIKTLLKYPDNFLYIYGLSQKTEEQKEGTATVEKDEHYLMQVDPRWAYREAHGTNFGTAGCGPTTLSMVGSLLQTKSISPSDMWTYQINTGHYVPSVGTAWSFMDEAPNAFGFQSKELPLTESAMKNALHEGHVLVLSVRAGDFTYSGHFVVVREFKDGKFYLFDPNSWVNSEKGWSFDTLQPQIKKIWDMYRVD